MKKIKHIYRKVRAKLTVLMGRKPILMTMLLLFLSNLLVANIGAVIAMIIDHKTYSNYFVALGHSVRWLILPSSVLSLQNLATIILAICIAVIGMVLFTGTVIAITTNYLRTYLNEKAEGRGKLALSDHIVILNYNSQVLSVLINLMHNSTEETVLLLSDKGRDFVQSELDAELAVLENKPASKLSLIIRKGNPLFASELRQINIKEAKSILIMDNNYMADIESEASNDYDIIKLMLRLSKFEVASECKIAVEAQTYKKAELVRYLCKSIASLQNKNIEVFSYNRKMGQFLALSLLCPPATEVLHNLFTFSGYVFYPAEAMSIEKYLQRYTGCIPISSVDDKTFVFTKGHGHLKNKREKTYKTTRRIKPLQIQPAEEKLNVFIIGENKKSHFLINSLNNQSRPVEVTVFEADGRKGFIAALEKNKSENIIALILSQDTAEVEERDENVFLTLIELNQKFGKERPFKVIAEISDAKNRENIKQFNVNSVVISSSIVGFFITNIITNSGSNKFYESLFTDAYFNPEAKFSLNIEDAPKILDFSLKLNFRSYSELIMSIYYGSDKTVMPLGIIRENQTIFFCNETDKKSTFSLQETDKLIYIKYII